jgi:hypothetical protein
MRSNIANIQTRKGLSRHLNFSASHHELFFTCFNTNSNYQLIQLVLFIKSNMQNLSHMNDIEDMPILQ